MGGRPIAALVSVFAEQGRAVVQTACAFRFLRQPSRPVSRRLDYGLRRGRTFAAKSIDAIKNPMAM
jgi:hypothetical protein